jgi:hypothetical protein
MMTSVDDQGVAVRVSPAPTPSSIQMLPVVDDIVNATRPFLTSMFILPTFRETKSAGESNADS